MNPGTPQTPKREQVLEMLEAVAAGEGLRWLAANATLPRADLVGCVAAVLCALVASGQPAHACVAAALELLARQGLVLPGSHADNLPSVLLARVEAPDPQLRTLPPGPFHGKLEGNGGPPCPPRPPARPRNPATSPAT
jgi:hypothetical protein